MNFFDKFLGRWTTKKNIFILQYNFKYTYEEQIKIIKKEDTDKLCSYTLQYNSNQFNLECSNYLFEKKKLLLSNKYDVQKINESLLKINCKLNNDICYTEYLHFINNNFNTSVGFIKKNRSYLAAIFTSYIKIYSK
uniref:Uncharacterized protein n=1 Tax=Caloglossa intermedia TaxID=100879 RepID=A0A1Z1M604_9FLOR|nr:hypothetical protein [Caloglossa intermedia]ARW61436.1 hypothetical protein [Caloglossa intermedia]